jgi:SNF2 family DNA or RNA helicase
MLYCMGENVRHFGPAKIGAERFLPDARLLESHRNLQLRRKKAAVLPQLPPKTTSHILLPLTNAQSETYKRAEEQGVLQLREMGAEVRVEHVLVLILRLKQICNFCPRTGHSAKLEDIRERLKTLDAEGHRALIFSQFTDEQFGVDAIASRLEDFWPLRYTGALSSPQRQATIQAFQTDHSRKILVLSLRAGGQGLNLQVASYVFHFDRWWNPAVERQAEDRSHRLG